MKRLFLKSVAASVAALAFAAGLSFLRVATDAEFAFASAVILPVVAVAWFEQVSDDFSEMVKAADDLMYEIKKDGKHGVRSKKFTMD